MYVNPASHVGEAGTMPGTAGFTMAVFKREDVPVGTRLYSAPPTPLKLPPVYLHLFHGRDDPKQDMDDWGYRGPTLGPFRYVQITYMSDIKFAMEREAYKKAFPEPNDIRYADTNGDYDIKNDCHWVDGNLKIVDGMVEFQGKFYGDFSVTAFPDP